MERQASLPVVPEFDGCDSRVQSAPVLVYVVGGGWYTARWTVYQDTDFAPVWELIGRDGLQLARDEVVSWIACADVAGLMTAVQP